jgi:hypothetical protein
MNIDQGSFRESDYSEQLKQLYAEVEINPGRSIECIVSLVLNACQTKVTLDRDLAQKLIEFHLLKESTPYRKSVYLGEEYVLHYDFSHKREVRTGFLGFDKDFKLITIDERYPIERVVHPVNK